MFNMVKQVLPLSIRKMQENGRNRVRRGSNMRRPVRIKTPAFTLKVCAAVSIVPPGLTAVCKMFIHPSHSPISCDFLLDKYLGFCYHNFIASAWRRFRHCTSRGNVHKGISQ